MRPHKKVAFAVATVLTAGLTSTCLISCGPGESTKAAERPAAAAAAPTTAPADPTVDLTPEQLVSIKVEPVGTASFAVEKPAIGAIDYDEDLSVQVFPPYQGKIIAANVNLGDEVKKGQPLYTIDSPDLIQAESTLMGAVAVYDLTTKELARAKALAASKGVSERELEQAISDQLTAEGAVKAARDAVRVFGKTDAEIDQVIANRKIDSTLVVPSPIAGRITARNAQPGLLVQPGATPAPYVVADLTTKWMIANVGETDTPSIHENQPVVAELMAYPGRTFTGKVSRIGTMVDPNTHRAMVRCDISDPKNELRPNMLTTFVIEVKEATESVSMPMAGVVRNGDGTMAAWVTTDKKRFTQRIIKVGIEKSGRYQIIDGLHAGELAISDGAVFVSNMLNAPADD